MLLLYSSYDIKADKIKQLATVKKQTKAYVVHERLHD
jgi:hypothetical protein